MPFFDDETFIDWWAILVLIVVITAVVLIWMFV